MEMEHSHYIWLLTFAIITTRGVQAAIGVNFGRVADNLPTAPEIASLVRSQGITKVKIYDADPAILSAFSGTGVAVAVMVPNEMMQEIATNPASAQTWVTNSITPFYPSTTISHVMVGNEILTRADPALIPFLLPAMKNVYTALQGASLGSAVRVSTPHAFDVLDPSSSFPPSAGAFKTSLLEVLQPIVEFLSETSSVFMVDVYPYFAYRDDSAHISLDYALFSATASAVTDTTTGLSYTNLFDAQVDAVYSALKRLGHQELDILVSESGWPSAGDSADTGATVENAATYNQNLISHVSQSGTPMRPGRTVDTYIFELFNEDQKTGSSSERNFGLFYPNMTKGLELGQFLEMEEIWRVQEASENTRREYCVKGDGSLELRLAKDNRPLKQKLVDGFLDQFFPVGYPQSVAEGYLVYSQFRALQHFSSAILSVMSTQSLVFAAGLRPTPAQATVVSWVLKDGMQHIGKLIGSRIGVQMDSEPKRWRIFADVLYDMGTTLEIISPVCPQYFLGVAGLANLAKGVAMVTARATRLPIYTAFAKEGNLSDLSAKGEAMSTLANVVGLGVGLRLASSACASLNGKLLVAPLLSVVHLYSVVEEMRAVPLNMLNPQRIDMLVSDYFKVGKVPSPAELCYRERLLLGVKPGRVKITGMLPLSGDIRGLKQRYNGERFLLNFDNNSTQMVLHHSASGEDVLRGWLLATCVSKHGGSLDKAYMELNEVYPSLLSALKQQGWQTQLFLEGSSTRSVW